MKKELNSEIIDYVEANILPKYAKIGGHTDEHVRQVIKRSLHFCEIIRFFVVLPPR